MRYTFMRLYRNNLTKNAPDFPRRFELFSVKKA